MRSDAGVTRFRNHRCRASLSDGDRQDIVPVTIETSRSPMTFFESI
jgi:hypothetical protein